MNEAPFSLALAGPALFVFTVLVFGLVKPKYRPLHNSISELALGKFGYIQTANFVVSGALVALLGGVLVHRQAYLYGSYAVVVMGVVLVLSAIFRTDPIRVNGSTATGKVHNTLFLLGMLAIMSAQFVTSFANLGTALSVFSLASGATAFLGFLAMVTYPARTGLFQRVLVLAVMGWIAFFGLSVLGW